MGRREQRAEMQRTWHVYVPVVAGKPFAAKDLHDANERAEAAATAEGARYNDAPKLQGMADYVPSRRVYPIALARVAAEERHKSTMPK
jgi:hypothetical protein